MIIDNASALACMKQDVEYYYYDIADIKCMSDDITVFSKSCGDLTNHSFVQVTRRDDEIFVEVHTDDLALISEAIFFAKTNGNLPILLSVDYDIDVSFIRNNFPIELCEEQDGKHWGIFGAIKISDAIGKSDIIVSAPCQDDIDSISNLPDKEWAFLPRRIKLIKNILIAKKGNDLVGYLVYDSAEAGHYDIVMIFVHPNYRRNSAASTLIKGFATECAKNNGIPYYVCANSASSAKLAEALNIKKVRKETNIYKLK